MRDRGFRVWRRYQASFVREFPACWARLTSMLYLVPRRLGRRAPRKAADPTRAECQYERCQARDCLSRTLAHSGSWTLKSAESLRAPPESQAGGVRLLETGPFLQVA